MTRSIGAALALALVLGACNGGDEQAGRGTFEVQSPNAVTSSKALPTVAPGKIKPPSAARMFAGTASVTGELMRYCKSSCVVHDPSSPTYLKAPVGAFVVFTIAESPITAVAEVRVEEGEKPGIVTLSPSTLMVFNHGLGEGRYLVDLLVRWRASEARWRFGLRVI